MIKGITFDFGETLSLGDLDKENFRKLLLGYIRSLGYFGGKSKVEKAGRKLLRRLMKARRLNIELRFEDLYQDMLFELELYPERTVIDYIHELYIRSFKTELIHGVEKTLEELSEKYNLAVISNAMSEVPRYAIKKFCLEKYLDTIVLSRDLGIRKPNPEIFKFTLKNLGIESHEAFHVGDSLRYDVQGAKNAGMGAIWLKGSNEDMNIKPDYTIHSINELITLL